MKAKILDQNGKKVGDIDLPNIFLTPYRPDIIRRAVLVAQSNRRQKYGTDKMAGERTSARYIGRTEIDPAHRMMQREMARLPRNFGDTAIFMRARLVPQTVGGRRAHPPKVEKNWEKKINKKERLLAIASAIAGTINPDLVRERNHIFEDNLPIIVDDSIQKIKKTKDVLDFLKKIGLEKELERVKEKKKRRGKVKLRRGKYKKRIGPLIVIAKDEGIVEAAKNIPGVDVIDVKNLNAEILSPGGHGIRLTVWTKSAIESLNKVE